MIVAMTTLTTPSAPELTASDPVALPFADTLHMRAFRLHRDSGDVLIYSAPNADLDGIARQYLNHWHEAAFGGERFAELYVHRGDAGKVAEHGHVRATFTRRHWFEGDLEVIPTPGHTPGATAYLWDSGEHRMLFTGDTIYLRSEEWVAAMLPGSSDRDAYVASLELLRELEFDVLVPWIASAGDPPAALTSPADARRRIDAIIERLRR